MATPQESLKYNVGQVYPAAGFEHVSKQTVTSATTLTFGDSRHVHTDTTGGAFTLTLPATPYEGCTFVICDGAAAGSWNTNNLTLSGNSKNIIASGAAAAATLTLSTRSQTITVRFNATSDCWHVIAKN